MKPARLKRLAETIDALVEKDDRAIEEGRRFEAMRARGALELHAICAGFVGKVNAMTRKSALTLDPADFHLSQFRDAPGNFFQIHVRGRILLLTFGPTRQMVSTENFKDRYILEGTARSFNQELLEHETVEENPVFYCIDRPTPGWRYFKTRSYQTGPLDEDYLASIFESLA